MDEKLKELESLLASLGRVAVGFSGGVDSSFLAAVCARAIPDRTVLIHIATPFVSTPERLSFEREAHRYGLPVAVVALDPLDDPAIAANPSDRCYRCKRAAFARLIEEARSLACDTVVEGSNADDAGDYRPGMRALRELGVRSPLMETGWTKAEERELLRAWGHPVWNMPAGACLATRIPTGEPLSAGRLELVRACEDALHELGLAQIRCRLVDGAIRVEASADDLDALVGYGATRHVDGSATLPDTVVRALHTAGAVHVELLARPYRCGSMNG